MITKVKIIKVVVLDMLTRFPETRDNDRLLMIYVWCIQNPLLKPFGFPFRDFANEFIYGHYADPESIRRTRQKIQEQHPELRGKSYTRRTSQLQEEMREEMRDRI